MKHLKLIITAIAAAACFSVTSCNYLDKDPENSVNESDVDFTNLDNMYKPVSGVYAKIRTNATHWVVYLMSEVRDDDMWSGRIDDQGALVDCGNYTYDNTYWGLNEIWTEYYGIIKVANAALESLNSYAVNITDSSTMASYRSYCGEVRFLRAYAYYRLTQNFGAVTILRNNAQTDMTRSTLAAAEKYMLEDLNYSMTYCKKLRPNEMEHSGAVTAYSAEALAAKIYLNEGNYEQVKALTDDIINSNKFSLYSNYYELFKIPGKLSNESLFEIQCTDFGNSSGDIISSNSWFACQGPANDGVISGWGFLGYYKAFRTWAKERGETVRYNTSFLEAGTTTLSGDSIKPLQNKTQTDCWNGKAYTPGNEMTTGRTDYGENNNIRILRYADVLLMNAEAKVRLGGNGDAPFNLVRDRAKMPELTNVTVDEILDERRMELCGEWGERYNDLVRTGKAESVLGPNGWTTDKTYYPIPYDQLQSEPTLNSTPKDE